MAPAPAVVQQPAADSFTSASMEEFAAEVHACATERAALQQELQGVQRALSLARHLRTLARVCLIGWVLPWFSRRVQALQGRADALAVQHAGTVVDVELDMPDGVSAAYQALRDAFLTMAGSAGIWDVLHERQEDGVANRSSATLSITRRAVFFDTVELPLLRCPHGGLHLRNAVGGDLLLYPAFAAVMDADGTLGFMDLREVELEYEGVRMIEAEAVPADAEVVDRTWEKVNKDGSRDRRFRDNRELPVVRYGQLRFRSGSGLHEVFHISDHGRCSAFHQAFLAYKEVLRGLG
jgi:hypothetical protein